MRSAKWTQPNQSSTRIEHPRDAVNLRGLERLFKRERWKDGRHPLRQHRLPRSRRPNHQNVVSARASHFESALRRLLPANIFEVHMKLLRLGQQLIGIDLHPRNAVPGVDVMN